MREVHVDLRVLLVREQVDDAIERLGCVVRVHRRENEMAGAGHVQRRAQLFVVYLRQGALPVHAHWYCAAVMNCPKASHQITTVL